MKVAGKSCAECQRPAKTHYHEEALCANCYKRARRVAEPDWAEDQRKKSQERKARLGKAHLSAYGRDYAHRTRAVCPECGGPMGGRTLKLDGSPGYHARERCHACHVRTKEHRYRMVQNMWLEGWTYPEICEALGYSKGYLSLTINRMRQEGWELPYRRRRLSPERQ